MEVRMACKPDFVQGLRPSMTIHLGVPLPKRSCNHPNLLGLKRPRPLRATRFLLGLASGGACHASDVTITAVGSYPTVSPFPVRRQVVSSLLRFPSGCPGRALPAAFAS